MQLPQIQAKETRLQMINQFQGYNHNAVCMDNEWYDMENMTNDDYPIMTNRMKRGFIRTLQKPQGMLSCNTGAWVDDDRLFYDESLVAELDKTGAERQLAMVGALLCVFPDGVIYNTRSGEITRVNNSVTTTTPPTFSLCKLDGTTYTAVTSTSEPSDKTKYWIDTSEKPVVMKKYSDSLSMWVSVPTTYVKISSPGIGHGFKAYDAAAISGVDQSESVFNSYNYNQSNLIYDAKEDYLVVVGLINQVYTNSQNITIERKAPNMDYIAEQDNRIWGCSSENHEIYACAQGDPTNWYRYAGMDSDSYAATVGTEGDFTGIAAYSGTIFFFKQEGFHRLYGSKPSNYEMSWKPGRGVQKGSSKSVKVVGDYLIYKARDGVCLYDGSQSIISDKLGTSNFYDAAAGVYRDKYYISMRDEQYNFATYVYDIRKGMWCKEDNKRFTDAAKTSKGLILLDEDKVLWNVNKELMYTKLFPMSEISEEYRYPSTDLYPGDVAGGTDEPEFEWKLVTGEMGIDTPYKKYLKKINVRFVLSTGAKMAIDIMYDDTDIWQRVMTITATKKQSYDIPVPVKRCDHLRVRISGRGQFKLHSIARAIEEGSSDA